MQPQLSEEDINLFCQAVFSSDTLQKIFSYLGRQETGRMLHINRAINNISQNSAFWFNIADRLQIDIKGHWAFYGLKAQVKNYYQASIKVLFNADLFFSTTSRFNYIIFHYALSLLNDEHCNSVTARSTNDNIIVGDALDSHNHNKLTTVMWRDGQITSLGLLNDGYTSEAQAISADSKVIVGWAHDGKKVDKQTVVIWTQQGIQSFNDYMRKKLSDTEFERWVILKM